MCTSQISAFRVSSESTELSFRLPFGLVLACLLGLGSSGCTTTGLNAPISQGLIIDNVTIVNTHDGKLQSGMAVVINNAKIVNIVPAGSVAAHAPAVRIDGTGKYVVPGFLDMHAHPLDSTDPTGALTLMLANGITGFRQMSGSPELLDERRQGKLLTPSALSPELLAMPGTILTRANAGTPEAAVAEVDRQKAAGADFIKVIDVGPGVFFTVAEEAKKEGLPFLGHLLQTLNVVDAARAGMRSIEHLGPHVSILLGCSTDEVALRQDIAQRPARIPPAPTPGQPPLAPRLVVNPIVFTDPADFLLYQHVLDTYSDGKCRDLAAIFVAQETWQTPTLIRLRTMEFGDDPRYLNDPNLRYVSSSKRQLWEEVAHQFKEKITPSQREILKKLWARQLKLVKLFEQTGVKMMAGSDSGSSAEWGIAGFGLHEEFDLLAEAGLSPLEVLQMTTLNGAQFLGRAATMGTVETGKDANLVLLNANPIESIQNLHKIDAVVRGGSYYSRIALDDLMHRLEHP